MAAVPGILKSWNVEDRSYCHVTDPLTGRRLGERPEVMFHKTIGSGTLMLPHCERATVGAVGLQIAASRS